MSRALAVAYWAIGVVIFVTLCLAFGLHEFRDALSRASPPGLALFLAFSSAVFFVYAFRWRLILRALGVAAPPLSTLLFFRASGHAAAWVVPSAHVSGESLRTFLLRRSGLGWGDAFLGVAVDRLVETTAGAVMGPIYIAAFLQSTGVWPAAASWVLGIMAIGGVGLAVLYANASHGGALVPFLARRGWEIPAAVESLRAKFADFVGSRHFIAALALSVVAEGLIVLEFVALTRAFGLALGLPTICAILVGLGVSHFAPVPAGVGTMEAAQVGVMALAGGGAATGLAIGLVVRLRETVWMLVGFAYLYSKGLAATAIGEANAVTGSAGGR